MRRSVCVCVWKWIFIRIYIYIYIYCLFTVLDLLDSDRDRGNRLCVCLDRTLDGTITGESIGLCTHLIWGEGRK